MLFWEKYLKKSQQKSQGDSGGTPWKAITEFCNAIRVRNIVHGNPTCQRRDTVATLRQRQPQMRNKKEDILTTKSLTKLISNSTASSENLEASLEADYKLNS